MYLVYAREQISFECSQVRHRYMTTKKNYLHVVLFEQLIDVVESSDNKRKPRRYLKVETFLQPDIYYLQKLIKTMNINRTYQNHCSHYLLFSFQITVLPTCRRCTSRFMYCRVTCL